MNENLDIFVLGLNHRVAPVEVRETVAYNPEEIPVLLNRLLENPAIKEGLILSTCNRTEIYVLGHTGHNIREILEKFVKATRPDFYPQNIDVFYSFSGETAIRHLFRVAAGLDSMILGEPQILGQVKDAFKYAAEAGTVKSILNRLLNFSVVVGKRVRSETALGEGAVSVAFAAVELAQKIFKDLYNHNILLIGAGDTGTLTVQHLIEKGVQKIYITNRTPEKARALAAQLNGTALPFEDFPNVLPKVDVIIGATSSPEYIITASMMRQMLSKRSSRPLFLIDIAVPRDFDPDINRLDNIFLHDIDDLQQIVERNLEKRRQEIPVAEQIIQEEVRHFMDWRKSLQVTPTIVALRERLDEIRHLELEKVRHKVEPEEYQKMEMITRSMMNKILHLPMVQLKKYNNGNLDGLLRIDVVRELFGLTDEEKHE